MVYKNCAESLFLSKKQSDNYLLGLYIFEFLNYFTFEFFKALDNRFELGSAKGWLAFYQVLDSYILHYILFS